MLRHALEAIEDRAALVSGGYDVCQEDEDEETKGGWFMCRLRDSERHMNGETP